MASPEFFSARQPEDVSQDGVPTDDLASKDVQPQDPAAEPAATIEDRGLLERVLRETISAMEGDSVEPQCMQRLLQVAKRYENQELTLDPIAIELVLGVVEHSFQQFQPPAEGWRTVSERIASVLMDDPQASERLKRFWARLVEAVR